MSNEIEVNNINKLESMKNYGNLDDEDNWDDWGDAEDNFEDVDESKWQETNNANFNESSKKGKDIPQDFNCNRDTCTQVLPEPELARKSSGGWGGLFGGVVSSMFSTATEGFGNITSTVSQGLNQVIGVPEPEELARMQATEAMKIEKQPEIIGNADKQGAHVVLKDGELAKQQSIQQQTGPPVFGLGLVTGVTTLGSKVLNTGLDTLEGIGKKTMHILQENDPLLMNKRKLLRLEPDRPNLSEILKEAKDGADQLEHTLKQLQLEKSREMLRFELLFENYCGLVHLEALEILSKESTLKLQTLQDSVSGNALMELKETINEVKELMELEDLEGESDGDYDGDELSARLSSATEDADLQTNFDDITNIWSNALNWLNGESRVDTVNEIFAKCITTLAETCALQMNKLHKIAELLLIKEHHSTANEVDCIVQLCKQFNIHLIGLTNRFAATITGADDEAKARISSLFAEMLVATQQIEKAFKLFLPILQIGAV